MEKQRNNVTACLKVNTVDSYTVGTWLVHGNKYREVFATAIW